MEFISPTKGRLTFDQVFADVMAFAEANPDDSYRLIVGTDSQIRDGTCFVTALIVHRKGKGARFYYTRSYEDHARSLRQRIFYEASLSLSLASRLAEKLAETGHEIDMEIHLDVGTNVPPSLWSKKLWAWLTARAFSAGSNRSLTGRLPWQIAIQNRCLPLDTRAAPWYNISLFDNRLSLW